MNEYIVQWFYYDEDGNEQFEEIRLCGDVLIVRNEQGQELFNTVDCC